MRIREITAVAAAIPLCLAELQHPLGYQYSETLPPHRESPFNDAFNQRVEQILEHFHIPGLAISVVNNGTTFAKGYGLSNIATSTPVTPETLFFAGSTTKAHTAAALSLLVDDNDNYPHIQWDTPVHTILPEFALSDPLYTSQITLTDMLSHRSGLPRHDMLMMLNTTAQDIVARLQHLPLTAPIRTKFQYCNLLYITAAHLIETVTGSSFEEFLQTNIWHPLGMTDTGFDLQAALDRNLDVAQGYYYDTDTDTDTDTATEDDTEKRKGNLYPTNRTYNPAITGAGNILTSATSYAKWMRALLTRRSPPLSHAGYEALFSAHTIGTRVTTAPFSAPDLYGLGWVIQNYRGETILQHGGAQDGYGALVVLLPGSGFGVAMLGNYMEGMNGAAQVLGFELVDNLLGVEEGRRFDWVGTIDNQIRQFQLTNETFDKLYPDLPSIAELIPAPLDSASYTGRYAHPAYPTLNISSTCPERAEPLRNPAKWTGVRLCGSFEDLVALPDELTFDFFHLTGGYWALVLGLEGMHQATRAEFGVSVGGVVDRVGVEFDGEMMLKGEKIWFERV